MNMQLDDGVASSDFPVTKMTFPNAIKVIRLRGRNLGKSNYSNIKVVDSGY